MKEPLIPLSDIPPEGTVIADLLGREVLVMMFNGKPRAYLNVSMHQGVRWSSRVTRSPVSGTARRSKHGPDALSQAPCDRTHD